MKYDISSQKAPAMPNLGTGTECIKMLLSQASKDMHEPLVPMFFPILGAHMSGAEFRSQDSCIWHRYQPNTTSYQAKPHAYQPDKTTTGMFIKRMLSLKYVTHVAICYLFLKAREKW